VQKKYKFTEDSISTVAEAQAYYAKTTQFDRILDILGINAIITQSEQSKFDLIELARTGLPKTAFESVSKILKLSFERLADLIHTSARTLQRKKSAELLNAHSSSQLILIAEVLSRALEVFDNNLADARSWLHNPLPVFNSKAAVDLLDTPMGKDLVITQLGRLEHGIY